MNKKQILMVVIAILLVVLVAKIFISFSYEGSGIAGTDSMIKIN